MGGKAAKIGDLLSPSEAARLAERSVDTIRSAMRIGALPYAMVGPYRVIARRDLYRYLANRAQRPHKRRTPARKEDQP